MQAKAGEGDALDVHNVAKKMLSMLGLRIKRKAFGRKVLNVSRFSGDVVRSFVSKDGSVLSWWNDNPARPWAGIEGNGMSCGSWTVFKDDDGATLSLFTEKVKKFSMLERGGKTKAEDEVANPFYGCKSLEEVLVRCDLLECCPLQSK